MAQVNYYLKNKKAKRQTTIYLSFTYDGYRIQTSTGLRIDPKFWDSKKGTIKYQYAHLDFYEDFNFILGKIRKNIIFKYYRLIKEGNGIIMTDVTKIIKKETVQPSNNESGIDFFSIYDQFIHEKNMELVYNTIKKYETLKNKLFEYQKAYNTKIKINKIDRRFYDRFKMLLLHKKIASDPDNKIGLLNDTISKYIACFKVFMKWAYQRGFHDTQDYVSFELMKKEKLEIITLTSEEIKMVEDYDFTKYPNLEKIKDVFLFSFYTGQRWSDISSFRKENVINLEENIYWSITTQKTLDNIKVPLFGVLGSMALNILIKYDWELPTISQQKYNDHLKEMGEIVGLNRLVSKKRKSGSRSIVFEGPLHQFITSHTARRTCVTLLLEKGVPPTTIMKLTGHTSFHTLLKYENTHQNALDNVFNNISL